MKIKQWLKSKARTGIYGTSNVTIELSAEGDVKNVFIWFILFRIENRNLFKCQFSVQYQCFENLGLFLNAGKGWSTFAKTGSLNGTKELRGGGHEKSNLSNFRDLKSTFLGKIYWNAI